MRSNLPKDTPAPTELAALVERSTSGKPLDARGRELVLTHLRLAYHVAWQYIRQRARDVPAEELISEALYGLTYAAGLYDETRQVPFAAYATRVIQHRVANMVVSWRRSKDWQPLLHPEQHCEPSSDVSLTSAESFALTDAREVCEILRASLPKRWYEVLYAHYAQGQSMTSIATDLGISPQRARQLLAKALERVQTEFPHWQN